MVEVSSFLVFMFCLVGCGVQAFFLGRQTGIENTIQYLHDKGIVEFEEYPNE
jgi:hypothetical protein